MIILDTHVWIFYISETFDQLSRKALETIEEAHEFGVSAISCWEAALLAERKRLHLNMEIRQWIPDALDHPKSRLINLSPEILIGAVQIELPQCDPADRMIAATCQLNNWSLVTADKKIQTANIIKTIW